MRVRITVDGGPLGDTEHEREALWIEAGLEHRTLDLLLKAATETIRRTYQLDK